MYWNKIWYKVVKKIQNRDRQTSSNYTKIQIIRVQISRGVLYVPSNKANGVNILCLSIKKSHYTD